MTKLYCSVCNVHTEHVELPTEYAAACTVCGTHMSHLMRVQAEALGKHLVTPEGTPVEVVKNTPNDVTFYVPSGAHKGYYDYDKTTGKKRIRQ